MYFYRPAPQAAPDTLLHLVVIYYELVSFTARFMYLCYVNAPRK